MSTAARRVERARAAVLGAVLLLTTLGEGGANPTVMLAVHAGVVLLVGWTALAPLPVGLHHTAMAALGGRLYLAGGYDDFGFDLDRKDAWASTPATNRWRRIADMPAPRAAHKLVALGGKLYAVGGGATNSVSLRELTALCAEATGWKHEPGGRPDTHPSDVPYFVADNREVTELTGWSPKRTVHDTLNDVFAWLRDESDALEGILA